VPFDPHGRRRGFAREVAFDVKKTWRCTSAWPRATPSTTPSTTSGSSDESELRCLSASRAARPHGGLLAGPVPRAAQVSVNTCDEKALIDDCEDGDDQILTREGRGGFFYTFADKAGSTVSPSETAFQMATGGPSGSTHAVHLAGKVAGSGEVYVGTGLDFTQAGTYDASRFKGVAFSAKVAGGTESHVRFMVGDVNTDPKGKICTACNNDFGVGSSPTNEWVRYEVPFSDLKQETVGARPARPPSIPRTSRASSGRCRRPNATSICGSTTSPS
jgi:hypothetical protein